MTHTLALIATYTAYAASLAPARGAGNRPTAIYPRICCKRERAQELDVEEM